MKTAQEEIEWLWEQLGKNKLEVKERDSMTWIKIKELRTNMDTGVYYQPTYTNERTVDTLFQIDLNGQIIEFINIKQRDNAIQKLDKKLNVDNLFKTEEDLF